MKDLFRSVNDLLTEAETMCNQKREELNNRIMLVNACRDKAETEKAAAEERATAAVNDLKMDDYHDAQKAAIHAAEEVQMCDTQLQKLQTEQLITVDTYRQYTKVIDEKLEEVNREIGGKLSALIKTEFIPARESVNNAIGRANTLYKTMLHDMLHVGNIGEDLNFNKYNHVYNDNIIDVLVSALTDTYAYQRLQSILNGEEE